mmetsp:Transcript_6406/g.27289  ORF Transcript_6406/g.27289 Transcript_6406/m.27289 type:complete len:217 (+) Transcript_6406:767-1417(+)
MLRFFARRKPRMFSFASISSEMGSMPFCVITTNPLSFPSHTFFFSAMTWRTTSSVYSRSAATIRSRCSASLYMKDEFTSDFSYSRLTFMVKMNASSTCLGMSGCLEPWSSTRPRTKRVSLSSLCFMCMISTMCRSMGSSGLAMQHTASTTMEVSLSASSSLSFERSAVFATQLRSSLSGFSTPAHFILNVSKNAIEAAFAASKPSTSTRGCSPSFK